MSENSEYLGHRRKHESQITASQNDSFTYLGFFLSVFVIFPLCVCVFVFFLKMNSFNFFLAINREVLEWMFENQ